MKNVMSHLLIRSAACLIFASPAMAQQGAMRDVATHDELSTKLRVANNQNPLAALKPVEGTDPTKVKPESPISRSDVLAFAGKATLVPKKAILCIPPAMAERVKKQPGSILQNWADFYAGNRSWITTVEVTRPQAEGNQPLAEDLLKRMEKSSSVVVATYMGGPISVLPLKVKTPVETANLKKP
jgi:hypothetical protein